MDGNTFGFRGIAHNHSPAKARGIIGEKEPPDPQIIPARIQCVLARPMGVGRLVKSC